MPVTVTVGVVGAAFAAYGLLHGRSSVLSPTSPAPPASTTVVAMPSGSPVRFTAAGYIEVIPPGPWVVSAHVPAMIRDIHVAEGQAVTAGQVVATLDERPFALDEAIAEAALAVATARLQRLEGGFRNEEKEQAEAAVALAQARLLEAQAQRDRHIRLRRDGASTEREVEAAIADADVAAATLRAQQAELALRQSGTRAEDIAIARAEVAQARAGLDRAHWRRQSCQLLAPRAGVVLDVLLRPGSWVAHDPGDTPAAAVLTMFDPQAVQVWADVNQRDIGGVREGQTVRLSTDAHPDRGIDGIVSFILPKANLQKNTVQVKIRIPDPPGDLRPETSVRVDFLTAEPEKEAVHAGN